MAVLPRLVRVTRLVVTTVHVLAVITYVELLVRWVPLPRLAAMLGLRVDLGPARPDIEQLPLAELPPRARREVRCARRVADLWPFSKGPCLRRALVAGHLLRNHDPALRLGVAGVGDDVTAHAWLEIGNRPLERVTDFAVFHEAAHQ